MKLLVVKDEAPAAAYLRRRLSGGLGLGLAIARAIAGARCAHISGKSRSGQGAAFTASLPASAPVPE